MSADNWGICPMCKDDPNFAFGGLTKTLREDYEIGTDRDGHFTISYHCACDCGFRFEHKYEKDIALERTAPRYVRPLRPTKAAREERR